MRRGARVKGNKMPVKRLPETKLKERDGALSCAVATRQLFPFRFKYVCKDGPWAGRLVELMVLNQYA